MTNLKTVISDTLSLKIPYSFMDEEATKIFIQELTDAIWDAIGDRLGETQEKLMVQLLATRTELKAERHRTEALYAELGSLRTQLPGSEMVSD